MINNATRCLAWLIAHRPASVASTTPTATHMVRAPMTTRVTAGLAGVASAGAEVADSTADLEGSPLDMPPSFLGPNGTVHPLTQPRFVRAQRARQGSG